MPDLEIQVSPETEAALKTNLTLRCVVTAAIQKIGQQTAGFSVQLIVIQMVGVRRIVDICYDLFLDECDPGLRAEISGKFDEKCPIHFITRKHKVFLMRRDPRVDAQAFEQYLQLSSSDKGPWPLFYDMRHPPFYEGGRRLIEYEELTSSSPTWRPWHLPQMQGEYVQESTTEDDELGQAEIPH
ncbi:uncharacterized protein LDX57_005873 [Aspergillus melleus]|uniref:uncharacterized protein n=1 Tax=Aspergillus melleus TaxID=138277 RepID=UPI001E8E2625|nr:uncharacterized protein LDX57_005873 [Aspergillus melleus]KAH8428168.1 hypothetical protein LDX57_005873 [Aspergillus melleus]